MSPSPETKGRSQIKDEVNNGYQAIPDWNCRILLWLFLAFGKWHQHVLQIPDYSGAGFSITQEEKLPLQTEG